MWTPSCATIAASVTTRARARSRLDSWPCCRRRTNTRCCSWILRTTRGCERLSARPSPRGRSTRWRLASAAFWERCWTTSTTRQRVISWRRWPVPCRAIGRGRRPRPSVCHRPRRRALSGRAVSDACGLRRSSPSTRTARSGRAGTAGASSGRSVKSFPSLITKKSATRRGRHTP